MYKKNKSVRRGDDDYNLTYYEDSIEKVVERVDAVDKQLRDVNRRVSANLTVLKCALFTIICLILILVALISVNIVYTFNINTTRDGVFPRSDGCKLSLDGDLQQSMKLENTSEIYSIQVIGPSPCKLTFLAVGGGGNENGGDGGAGSGYLKYLSINVDSETEIIANVGDEREASTVAIVKGHGRSRVTTHYKAKSGQDAQGDSGGRGYSGGGARGSYTGGENGNKGEGSTGGKGTGEDISAYIFSSWSLQPGPGGKALVEGACHFCGGGGGGVLIDGYGPDGTEWQGSGYGGGGSGFSGVASGLPGVILIEVS